VARGFRGVRSVLGCALLARFVDPDVVQRERGLAREKARQRRRYVQQHPEQMTLLRRLAACGMPLSVRQAGLWNDLHQYAQLLVYPLEQIICPTLVLHGRADGNVPFAHAEFVARTVPKVELLVLEDCGHLIWVGPGATQAREKVITFLKRHAPLAHRRT
jgi:pimeloyl-ACP methyl ester carboxylesterase